MRQRDPNDPDPSSIPMIRENEMIPKEARIDVALERYLAATPSLQEEISALSPEEQKQQAQWAFEDEAESRGIEPWELVLDLVAETPEELKAMRLEVHQEVAEALGMDLEDYLQLNEIES
ncbi:hypothetical protein PLD_19530 [Pseudomonas sp. LD120]|nr:hypothetical protein PLD_19530 [Pseudomonas sp. LD120]